MSSSIYSSKRVYDNFFLTNKALFFFFFQSPKLALSTNRNKRTYKALFFQKHELSVIQCDEVYWIERSVLSVEIKFKKQ